MADFWWSLPGPLEFCRRVAADLDDGSCVVLAVPRAVRSGLAEAVRAQMVDLPLAQWRNIAGSGTEPPGELLADALFAGNSPFTVPTPELLATAEQLSGHVFCLRFELSDSVAWGMWRTFLEKYAQAIRARPVLARSPLLVILQGSSDEVPVREDVCLRVRRWQNCVGELDMLLYCSVLLRGQTTEPFLRALLAGTVASVAGADPELAEFLARESPAMVLDPRVALKNFAAERQWTGHEPNWTDGSLDSIDGVPRVHSCLPGRDPQELQYLLWRAQVTVILPYIEQQRRWLLGKLAGTLRLPFRLKNGTCIDRTEDLEIGHIAYLVGQPQVRGVSESLRQHICALHEARNALAHLETLLPEKILNGALRRAIV